MLGGRGKGSNEAGEMYVWLPISNIYEEQALGLAGRRGRRAEGGSQAGRILCYASIEKWADQESDGGKGLGRRQVYMSNLHFQYFLLGRKHQLSSQSAALHSLHGMVLPGFERAGKGQKGSYIIYRILSCLQFLLET